MGAPWYNTLPLFDREDILIRKDYIEAVDVALSIASTERVPAILLYGPGGIGKTQTALSYAYQNVHKFDAVFWISGRDDVAARRDFTRAAVEALELAEAHPAAHEHNRTIFLRWLRTTSSRWLVIVDDLDIPDILDQILSTKGRGAVIGTVRDNSLAGSIPHLLIDGLSEADAMEFLLHLINRDNIQSFDMATAHAVVKITGSSPLVLSQLAGYIRSRNMTQQECLELLQTTENNSLKSTDRPGYGQSIGTAWDMAFEDLSEDSRTIACILSLMNPDSIRVDFFRPRDLRLLPAELLFCKDESRLQAALDTLLARSLVARDASTGTLMVHRLMQNHIQESILPTRDHEYFDAAIALLMDKAPSGRNDYDWTTYDSLVPHISSLSRWKHLSKGVFVN